MRRPWFNSWVRKIHWRRDRLPTPVSLGFPCDSAAKESSCNVGDLGLTPGLGRSPGEGKGYPLQYSGLENSMDCIVYGVTKSWTQLSDFHFHFINLFILFLKKWSAARNIFWKYFIHEPMLPPVMLGGWKLWIIKLLFAYLILFCFNFLIGINN